MNDLREAAREKLQEYVTISQSGGSIDLNQLSDDVNDLLTNWRDDEGVVVTTNFGQPILTVKFEEDGDSIVMRTNGGW